MTLGTVRSFDVLKGYGFIEPDSGGVEVLVTICAVERAGLDSLYQGEKVSFDVVKIGDSTDRAPRRFQHS